MFIQASRNAITVLATSVDNGQRALHTETIAFPDSTHMEVKVIISRQTAH